MLPGLHERSIAFQSGKLAAGHLNILATFNNTLLTLCDTKGNTVMAASSGALGFKGSRKSTPFAAAKVGEIIGEKAQQMGMKEAAGNCAWCWCWS
jgi:small subunit ribosomal protein S11